MIAFIAQKTASGVHGNFISHAGLKDYSGHWGLELRGTKGAARITTDIPCQVFIQERTKWDTDGRTVRWQRPEELPATGDRKAGGSSLPISELSLIAGQLSTWLIFASFRSSPGFPPF